MTQPCMMCDTALLENKVLINRLKILVRVQTGTLAKLTEVSWGHGGFPVCEAVLPTTEL